MIKNTRLVNSNNNDVIERLKNEGNTHFMIGNYFKSLEAYTNALKTIETHKNDIQDYEKRKIQVLNNRGNNYIKLKQFNDALKDLNIVLELESNNVKALYRRGLCLYNLKNYRQALDGIIK